MKADCDIMIEMIRDYFNQKLSNRDYVCKWDYPMSIDLERSPPKVQGDRIFIWYYVTHPVISFKKEKLINFRFPWSKKVEEPEEAAKPTLGYITIDKEEYEFKVAYREADKRNKKIDSILWR